MRCRLEQPPGDLGLERVEMTTTPDNAAVAALAAKLGFAQDGTPRARNLERGRRVDVVMFGLLRDDWAAVSRATAASRGHGGRAGPHA